MLDNILQGNPVEILVCEAVKVLPDVEGYALVLARAGVLAVFEAGDGRKRAFGCAEDIADGALVGGNIEHITAAVSAICADEPRLA